MQNVYNQKLNNVIIDGFKIDGLSEGATIDVTFDGGEVEKTHGTDGPGLNLATEQGGTVVITLQQLSRAHKFMKALWLKQKLGAPLVNAVATLGTGAILTMLQGLVTLPRQFQTGDKKQGAVPYAIVCKIMSWDNL